MLRNIRQWAPGWLLHELNRERESESIRDVYFCVADHFEPFWSDADGAVAHDIVRDWALRYPEIAARHADSAGRPPQHSFFYPQETYDERVVDGLASLCHAGYGAVEVHLHHDNDNAAALFDKLTWFAAALNERHGLLRRHPRTGQALFAFIHGNWALDNSRPDGRWCGVDNELDVLLRAGCRLDMTMPSAPSDTQTRKVNSIYFARGADGCRKGHDGGRDVTVGQWRAADELLMVQGPLGFNPWSRKYGILPRIENGELSADNPPTAQRVRLWQRFGATVAGAEHAVFIKLHTHGAQPATLQMLLDGGLRSMWGALEEVCAQSSTTRLHYVTAWEMYETIRNLAEGRARSEEHAA